MATTKNVAITINISLPKEMYKDLKRAVKTKRYTSVSEMIRASLRKDLYEEITENGFTNVFEDKTLESAMEPEENDIVLETEKDIDDYFKHLKIPQKDNGKNKRVGAIQPHVSRANPR